MSKLEAFLAECERLDKEATPGPWISTTDTDGDNAISFSLESPALGDRNSFGDYRRFMSGRAYWNADFVADLPDSRKADVAFMAKARTALPLLVKMVMELTLAHDTIRLQVISSDTLREVVERVLEDEK